MVKKIFISEAKKNAGEMVVLSGWVYNKRSSGGVIFLQIRDGSGFMQTTFAKGEVSDEVFDQAQKVTLESSVSVSGLIREEKRAESGWELGAKDIEIIQLVDGEFPIGKKEHGPDFLLSNRHLWIRSKRQYAIIRLRGIITRAITEFLDKEGFTRFDAPIITPSACEGTTTLFELDYFGERAFLTQSGQLYLEAAIASLGRVYDFGPIMRAEKSKTRRHLIEFWMMDAEAAFLEFEENLDLQEDLIKYVVSSVLDKGKWELEVLERDKGPLDLIRKSKFLRLTYDEAVEKLKSLGSDIKLGEDFGNDDETLLMTHYKLPLFVTHFPADFKAFYFKRSKKFRSRVLAADLLAPEGYGEIIGGGQREDDYSTLLKRMRQLRLPVKDYSWYLDLRKFGSIPHSGFGLGLERLLAWIGKLTHVRETIPFPRLLDRFSP